ncbi:hypothetical protein ZHAS_00005150 [Anopheles sinensis]|uniref:Uncharacterized protein n=1 Tax=Anopheles sinensis TaxID=74873 RepID=A0A084VJ33_ANOSI|nr:hypothetical protein ZHAS_00005150 [Anopheles sinensis]
MDGAYRCRATTRQNPLSRSCLTYLSNRAAPRHRHPPTSATVGTERRVCGACVCLCGWVKHRGNASRPDGKDDDDEHEPACTRALTETGAMTQCINSVYKRDARRWSCSCSRLRRSVGQSVGSWCVCASLISSPLRRYRPGYGCVGREPERPNSPNTIPMPPCPCIGRVA